MSAKLSQTLQSRKAWASAMALVLLSVLFYLNAISGETFAWGLTIAAGVFTGAVALEDGLTAIFLRVSEELDEGQEAGHEDTGDLATTDDTSTSSAQVTSSSTSQTGVFRYEMPTARLDVFKLLQIIEERSGTEPARCAVTIAQGGYPTLSVPVGDRWFDFDLTDDLDRSADGVALEILASLSDQEADEEDQVAHLPIQESSHPLATAKS